MQAEGKLAIVWNWERLMARAVRRRGVRRKRERVGVKGRRIVDVGDVGLWG